MIVLVSNVLVIQRDRDRRRSERQIKGEIEERGGEELVLRRHRRRHALIADEALARRHRICSEPGRDGRHTANMRPLSRTRQRRDGALAFTLSVSLAPPLSDGDSRGPEGRGSGGRGTVGPDFKHGNCAMRVGQTSEAEVRRALWWRRSEGMSRRRRGRLGRWAGDGTGQRGIGTRLEFRRDWFSGDTDHGLS